MVINHLVHSQIDKERWDEALSKAPNTVVYANSWYLDMLCPEWEALVAGDYEYIMPLPVKRFLGFRIVYKPIFIQKLGIFSAKAITTEVFNSFLKKAFTQFWYIDYALQLESVSGIGRVAVRKRRNFVLPIHSSYDEISSGYSSDAKRSLKKKQAISFEFTNDFDFVIDTFRNAYGDLSKVKSSQYQKFKGVILEAEKRDSLICVQITKENVVIGAGLFIVHKKRAYYVLGAPTSAGRKSNATHFLIDGFIREFAGKLEFLDFEGSDIESVAYFYQKWGSVDECYFQLSDTKHVFLKLLFALRRYLRSSMISR